MADREVSYRLAVQTDRAASAAFDDLSKKSQRLEQDANKASRAVSNVTGSPNPGGGGSGAAAAAGGAGLTGLASTALVAFGAIKALEGGLKVLTAGVNAYNSGISTEHQRRQDIGRSIPVIGAVGGAIQDFAEAIAGIPEKLRIAAKDATMIETEARARFTAAGKNREGSFALSDAQARTSVTGGILNRVAGDPQLQEDLLSDKYGQQTAARLTGEREAGIANARLAAAAKEQADAKVAADRATADRLAAVRAVPTAAKGAPEQLKIVEATYKATVAIANEKRALERLEQAGLRTAGLANEAAQKKVELSKLESEVARNKLQFAKEELATAEGMAAQFGKLNPAERAMANEAAKRLKQFGTDAVTGADLDLLGRTGVYGKTVEQEFAKTGLNDPAFREALLATGSKTVEALKKEITELKPQVAVSMYINEDKFAKALEAVLLGAIRDAKVRIDQQLTNELQAAEMQAKMGNALRKGGS